MGNIAISPCCYKPQSTSWVKLIFYEGTTKKLTGNRLAGEIMFEYQDQMVCHADSFFIGHAIPSLAIDDELVTGQTYFVLPLDCFSSNILTASSLARLGTGTKHAAVSFKGCPFEYLKGSDGRVLIKVLPEFIVKLITGGNENGGDQQSENSGGRVLCSTPELKKHYDQLVGSKDHVWSPKLETISEYKTRYSPCRFIGLEWKQKETDYRS